MSKIVKVQVTRREGQMIQRAIGSNKFSDIGHYVYEKNITIINASDESVKFIRTQLDGLRVDAALTRGEKQVVTRLINRIVGLYAEAVNAAAGKAKTNRERWERRLARLETPVETFTEKKVTDDGIVILRVRPVDGKHGDNSLTKIIIKPLMVMSLGALKVRFNVSGVGENLIVDSIEDAENLASDLINMWKQIKMSELADEIAELKARLAA